MDRNMSADKYIKELDASGEMALNKLLREISPDTRVLEFGPASGAMTKALKGRGCAVSIVEIDPECYERAMAYAADGWLGNIDTLEWTGVFPEDAYNYVVFADVLEHLHEPSAVLRACLPLLKEDGRLLVSVPNVAYNGVILDLLRNRFAYTDTGILDNTHVHLFAYDQAVEMLTACGYTPVMQDGTYVEIGASELTGVYESVPGDVAAYLRGRPLGEAYQLLFAARKTAYAASHPLPLDDRLGGAAEYVLLRDKADAIEDSGALLALMRADDAYSGEKRSALLAELARHAGEIYQMNSEIARLSELVSAYSRAEGSSAAQIDALRQLRKQLNERDAEILRLGGEVEKLSAWGKGLDEEVARRDGTIAGLNGEIEKLSAWGRGLDEEVARRGETIDGLNARIDELSAWGRGLDETVAGLNETVAGLNETVSGLEAQNVNLLAKIRTLEEKELRLYLIETSKAWKVGRALQKISGFLLPMGSRRRLVVRYVFRFLRHPVAMIRRLQNDRGRFAHFRGRLVHGDKTFSEMQEAPVAHVEPPKVEEVKSEKAFEDYAPIAFPTWASPVVSIVIPVYNQFEYTYECLRSILNNTPDVPYEVIIADDCSTDCTTRIQEIARGVRVARTATNQRFLRNCNNAARQARGEFIFFLNNDTQVQPDWLGSLVRLMREDESIGMTGSKLVYPDGRLQEAGGVLWRDGSAWNYGNRQDPEASEYNYVKDADYISGAAIMIRADLWREIGGFDEAFAPAYYEDTDLAFEVRRHGKRVVYQPASVVVHFEGVSNGTDTSTGLKAYQIANQAKFLEKWKDVLAKDHFENGQNIFQARDRSRRKRTILVVDHYVPMFDKDAGSRCVFQYLQLYLRQGLHVKFIGDNFARFEPYTRILQQMGVEVLYGDEYAMHWKEWLERNGRYIDFVMLNRPHISVKYIDKIRKCTHAKVYYFGHDLHFLRERRRYEATGAQDALALSEDWYPKEVDLMRKSDEAWYPSQVEADEMHRRDASLRVRAIPLFLFDGSDPVAYRAGERRDIMFVGGFNHTPNVDAVRWFHDEIWPTVAAANGDIRVNIIGSHPPREIEELQSDRFLIRGFLSDEELEGYYHSCRMVVVPLRYGAGIKGKVVEAMVHRVPILTTSIGAEGIACKRGSIATHDDAAGFAQALLSLYGDEAALDGMSAEYERFIRDVYSYDHAAETLSDEFDGWRGAEG